MDGAHIPRATYRIQLNGDFTFTHAAELVPYLSELGISHFYASPYLKARTGSSHGYDIVDHNALNPEIGDRSAFEAFTTALAAHGMGQILDLVPNHMGVGGDDNAWWLDVLENGEGARHAPYFDIDWHPVKENLRGKILVPLLGDHYGAVLENGDLELRFDQNRGSFSVHYYEHCFPVDPRTYPDILSAGSAALETELGAESAELAEHQSLITAFQNLPGRDDTRSEEREARNRDKEIHKRRLAELCRRSDPVARVISRAVAGFNGVPGEPHSFDRLHALLERQAYRLAFWQVASDEINYRRFFDINDLAGLRMDNPEVFEATHRLVLELMGAGVLDGLRIDHPDGLYDPLGYYRRLAAAVQNALGRAPPGEDRPPDCYLVVEKILATYERLPPQWPVHGTTGYEFAALLNALLVHPDGEKPLTRLYNRFTGREAPFEDVLFERKKLIIRAQLSSELTVLANQLNHVAQADRHTRDFTLNGLREALSQVTACFPVYRTYVSAEQVSDEDRRYVDWAIAQATKRSAGTDVTIFTFLRDILLEDRDSVDSPELLSRVVQFAMKFQQYTAPAMAKGLEDTTFYVYNRLVSANEVGDDPRRFAVSPGSFHHANQERVQNWPHGMLATSTHDTKRSEDVRARINVLSELPEEWRRHVGRWSRVNRSKRRTVDGEPAPSRNDEYLLYQTLLGAWPLETLDPEGMAAFRERIEQYMIKAVREAKLRSSWINPNADYEQAVTHFIRELLKHPGPSAFLTDFLPFQRRVAGFGLLNSLSQTVLKLNAPGVPDIYQGNELWNFSLVDPDNRRPVDFHRRRALLSELRERAARDELAGLARELALNLTDGRAKLYLTWQLLALRQRDPDLFVHGDYLGLAVDGRFATHFCAYARRYEDRSVLTLAPRWYAVGEAADATPQTGIPDWPDTWLEVPGNGRTGYRNLFTGHVSHGEPAGNGQARIAISELLRDFPVAVLTSPSPPP